MRRVALVVVWIGTIGCGKATANAPDPQACTTAADCAPSPLFDPDRLCCNTGIELTVRSKVWLEWYAHYHAYHCGGVTCPTLPPPTPPMACATQPRCVQHRCMDSCSPSRE